MDDLELECAQLRDRLAQAERVLARYIERYGLTDDARRVMGLPPIPPRRP